MRKFAEIVSVYTKQYPADLSLKLQFGDCRIRFRTNNEKLLAFLADYFTEFSGSFEESDIVVSALESPEFDEGFEYSVKQPDPGKTRIKEEWIDLDGGRIVRKVLTGLVLMFGGESNLAVGPCQKNNAQVINFIIHRYIEWLLKKQGLLLHAAGVRLVDRGIALAGFSGMGKSTLALHLMNKGTDFVSNDRAIVRKSSDGVLLHGVPKMPRINPGTIIHNSMLQSILKEDEVDRYNAMQKEELWDLEEKHDALIHQIYGEGRFALVAQMHGLVVLNWQDSDVPVIMSKVEISERRDLLPAFTKTTGLFNDPDASLKSAEVNENDYIEFFRNVPVYEITGGRDFEQAVELCMELIR